MDKNSFTVLKERHTLANYAEFKTIGPLGAQDEN